MMRFPGLKVVPLGHGEEIRDWSCLPTLEVLWPNDSRGNRLSTEHLQAHIDFLWPYRKILKNRKAFGVSVEEKGIPWWALREVYIDKIKSPLSIAFAEVATHNHFCIDRGGKVFKQTAPVIKLSAEATEDDHLTLQGLLNSSTACFWLKQVCFPKKGFSDNKWEERIAFNATNVEKLPIPERDSLVLATQLDENSQKLQQFQIPRYRHSGTARAVSQ